jgi:hypothetical protein
MSKHPHVDLKGVGTMIIYLCVWDRGVFIFSYLKSE